MDTWEYFVPLTASYVAFGTGCAGSAGTPTLAAASGNLPWLGEQLTCNISRLPNSPVAVPFGLMGVSRQSWLGIPLPFDLAPLGAAGCNLRVSIEQSVQLVNNAGTAQWSMELPRSVALLAARFFQQAMVLDPTANTLGVTVTNAAEAVIGDH